MRELIHQCIEFGVVGLDGFLKLANAHEAALEVAFRALDLHVSNSYDSYTRRIIGWREDCAGF